MTYAVAHYHKRSPETSTLIDQLLMRYGVEGLTMPRTLEEFRQYYLREHVHELPPEERLRGLPPEERLRGLTPAEIRAYLKRLENGATPAAEEGA